MLYAEVVDRGVVELPLPADNVYIREFLLDLLIVGPCRLFCAVVLHDDKLEVLVRPFRQHRADTVVEIDGVVLVRDDHGDKRISLDLKCRVINAVVGLLAVEFGWQRQWYKTFGIWQICSAFSVQRKIKS